MNEAAKEPKPLPNILPIVANVIFRDSRVNCQKTLHALRLREQVCSVPQLRRLGYYCLPQVKNILVAEQVKTLRTTGVYEFLLKQFNPDNLDYGAWMEQRRQAFLEARIRNPYFGYSLFATLTLCLMTGVCAKMWIDHRRALWVTAEWMADVYNHDLYSREAAREAIQRYNEHIERCNRAIEAGESGHSC